jgi:hypothetical protein
MVRVLNLPSTQKRNTFGGVSLVSVRTERRSQFVKGLLTMIKRGLDNLKSEYNTRSVMVLLDRGKSGFSAEVRSGCSR